MDWSALICENIDFNMLLSGLFAFLGTLFGWGLNQLTRHLDNKPKLVFALMYDGEGVLSEDRRTKTSESGYKIETFNIGKVPVVFNQISLYYKGKLLIDCFLDDDERVILPYKSNYYPMMEQDREALQWHCNEKLFEKCDVIVYCIDGKNIKGKLDVSVFYLKLQYEIEHFLNPLTS